MCDDRNDINNAKFPHQRINEIINENTILFCHDEGRSSDDLPSTSRLIKNGLTEKERNTPFNIMIIMDTACIFCVKPNE